MKKNERNSRTQNRPGAARGEGKVGTAREEAAE